MLLFLQVIGFINLRSSSCNERMHRVLILVNVKNMDTICYCPPSTVNMT